MSIGNDPTPEAAKGGKDAGQTRPAPAGALSSEAIPAQPSVDLTILLSLRELHIPGEPNPIVELVGLFLNDAPSLVARIAQGARQSDARVLETAAHTLKGSAANLGAVPLAALCGHFVGHARRCAFDPARDLLEVLDAEFARVRQILLEQAQAQSQ